MEYRSRLANKRLGISSKKKDEESRSGQLIPGGVAPTIITRTILYRTSTILRCLYRCIIYSSFVNLCFSPNGRFNSSAAMPPRPKARRTHLLGSCKTCRRRHVRCDTKRPACQTCAALGLTCEGFADEIQWTPPRKRSRAVIKDGPVACFGIRRQLFTGSCLAFVSCT